jgi:hypothetical protein
MQVYLLATWYPVSSRVLQQNALRRVQVGQNYVLSFWSNDTADADREGREPHTRWVVTAAAAAAAAVMHA